MSPPAESPADTHPVRRVMAWAARPHAALWLIVAVTVVRVVYLAWLCPYTLIEDEAHYWEWSRRLALSYYTKGPGVAWTIAATTWLVGPSELGVRLAAPISSAIGAWMVSRLAKLAGDDPRAPTAAALCWLIAPMFQVMGLLMTIDGPYAACWAVATWCAWSAMARGRGWAWPALGLAIGVGALFKYTILLLIPGLLAWAVWRARRGGMQVRPGGMRAGVGVLLALVAFGVAVSPIVIWNAREGWPTISHLLGHLGVKGGDMPVTQGDGKGWHYDPRWTLDFLLTQIGLVGPLLVIMLAAVLELRRVGANEPHRAGRIFVAVVGAPILVFYFLVSFVTEPEGNWPLAGYITLMPLAAVRLLRELDLWSARLAAWRTLPHPRPRAGLFVRRPESPTQVAWYAGVALGIGTALAAPRLDLLAKLPVVGRVVPVHRFTGADRMGRDADARLASIEAETGLEPFVVAQHYGRASQLAFYMKGRPTVYCAGSLAGGRHTQYDYWRETDLRQDHGLLGRPALLIGDAREAWQAAFDSVRPAGTLDGDGKRNRPVWVGLRFKGFPGGWPAHAEAAPRVTK